MAVITDINALSTNQALNGPDGSVDPPSTLDDQLRYHGAFIAQLRDGGGTPTGAVLPMLTTTAPTGWIKANGALVSRTTYAALFAFASAQGLVTETAWSATDFGRFSVGDGSTTFRLPDLRGMFLRGLDESRGFDTGRTIGVDQAASNAPHTHTVTDPGHNHAITDPGHIHFTDTQGSHAHNYTGQAPQPGVGAGIGGNQVYGPAGSTTDPVPGHQHNLTAATTGIAIQNKVTGISLVSQGTEGRPRNLAFPHYIKF